MAKPNDTKAEAKTKVAALLDQLSEDELNHILTDPMFRVYTATPDEPEEKSAPRGEASSSKSRGK